MWRMLFILVIFPLVSANTPICDTGFTLVNNKCLMLVTDLVNHTAAERRCGEYGATLVTVKSTADNTAISTIAGNSAALIWIGLLCYDNDPSKCYWDDASGAVYVYNGFADGFPLVDVGRCVYYSNQGALKGKWINGQCNTEFKSFVCELPTTYYDSGDCTINYNGFCYNFMGALTFDNAQASCQARNGNLASIHSAQENAFLAQTMRKRNLPDYLIGLRYFYPDIFSWLDGSVFDYTNLDSSKPLNSTCFAISNGFNSFLGGWYSVDCNASNSFLCKRPAGSSPSGTDPTVTVTPLPANPSYCNAPLLMAPNFISSPNYPSHYDNNSFCTYKLSTLGSYNILLRFLSFTTERTYDYVCVYDGDSVNKKLVGNYSGSLQPFSLVSTGNTMIVTFSTDASNVAQGFQARFTPYAYGR